jgi:hypothetical protein
MSLNGTILTTECERLKMEFNEEGCEKEKIRMAYKHHFGLP